MTIENLPRFRYSSISHEIYRDDLRYVKTVFEEKYNQDLGDFLSSGLKGEIKSFVSVVTSKEREYYAEADEQLAEADAQRLINASELFLQNISSFGISYF
ncbi:hypothetical protein TNCV_3895631 [Trichonephila clavipes]|nr:hypothetical protein TNCV_3895631 [Trichonephila clavipes]